MDTLLYRAIQVKGFRVRVTLDSDTIFIIYGSFNMFSARPMERGVDCERLALDPRVFITARLRRCFMYRAQLRM